MTAEIRIVNIIFSVIGFILANLGLIHILTGYYASKKMKRFFLVFFIILNLYTLCIMLRELTYYHTGQGWSVFSRILFFGQGLSASTLPLLITAFILRMSGEMHLFKNVFFLLSLMLWGFYAFLMVQNQFSGNLYSVDEKNAYVRGPYFPLLIVCTALIMVLNMVVLLINRDKLSDRQKKAFLVYISVPTVSMIIQARFFGLHLIALSTVIAALFTLIYIISEQQEVYRLQKEENIQLKEDILLAQIQPHFLFNSLTTIRYLCREDPEKAEEGVTEFAKYLRRNMDSLSMDHPVPLEDELEHVREYLALQKLRFGDELKVNYELEYTDFNIPVLTLQPLVENAVVHGIRANGSGTGLITLRSKMLPDHYEVTIEDDGAGFDAKDWDRALGDREDGRSHMGLTSIKNRLAMMCGGSLEMESKPGAGTVARVIIPEQAYFSSGSRN